MHRSIIAAAALMGAITALSPAYAEETRMPRTISLSGHGEARLAPDMATVTAGVVSQGATAGEALAANTAAMDKLFASLKAAGIAERDIQTSNFSVQPRYDFGSGSGQAPKLVGYDVSNNLTITLRKLEGLGKLLDSLVKAGSNQINGVSFDVSEPEQAMDQARKAAAADATRKAKVYAEAMGVSLGAVVSISEGFNAPSPAPIMRAKAMMADAASVPIAAGEQTLSVDVNIAWEIR